MSTTASVTSGTARSSEEVDIWNDDYDMAEFGKDVSSRGGLKQLCSKVDLEADGEQDTAAEDTAGEQNKLDQLTK